MKSRENAFIILDKIENEGIYANLALKNFLNCREEKEKSFATELVYGVLRYKLTLDYVINKFCTLKNCKVRNILRIGAYQLLYMDRVPDSAACNEAVSLSKKYAKNFSGLVNSVMRKICQDEIVLPDDLEIKYSFPADIIEVIKRTVGEEKTDEVLANLNKTKFLSLRINKLRISEKEFENILTDKNIEFTKNENCYFIKKYGNRLTEEFENGLFTWQGNASVMAVKLLSPLKGDRVLDLCASPGGKSCLMGELMENTGEIYSCDLHLHRTKLIDNTARRLGINIIKTFANDASVFNDKFGLFDKILADVPCSGLGVIGKKPDIKWRDFDFDSLADLQFKILKTAVRYVKDEGEIVYSTCTVNKTENENVVKRLLNEVKTVKLASDFITIYPTEYNDGFFMCKLKKVEKGL